MFAAKGYIEEHLCKELNLQMVQVPLIVDRRSGVNDMLDRIPLSIGGGIGPSRTFMYLLRTAHLGEVSVTVWPEALRSICAERDIHGLE